MSYDDRNINDDFRVSFSNDDGDGNEDVKEAIGLLRKKTTFTLVPEVFLDFSSRKRSTASREAATTSRVSDDEREKNLWLP